MNKEELLKEIMKLPKAETINPISTMNSINIDDLMSAVDRLNKVPNYNDLLKENKKYKEVIDKATDKCNKTLDYINNTLLKNNVKVELTELLEIKGGLDIILESLVEDQLKRCNK